MDPIPFRIKLGVTGHRSNLPDIHLLKHSIRQAIGIDEWNRSKTASPNSVFALFDEKSLSQLRDAKDTPLAFSLLTALAEGADRIAAEAVLEIEGSKIEAVLPLSKEDYLTDFKTEESKNEFERLLEKDLFASTLINRKTDGLKEDRNTSYLNAGKFIVDSCEVLIAIWNGEEGKGKGGTFDVISYARDVNRPIIIISSTTPEVIIAEKGSPIIASAIEQIDHFNSYKIPPDNIQHYVDNIEKDFFNQSELPESKNFDPAFRLALRDQLFPYYAQASLLAKSYKNRFIWTGQLTYIFATSAVIVLLINVIFGILPEWVYYIEFVLLFLILTLISIAHKRKVHTRWLEYRFLVERIRVAPYFFLAGRDVSGITPSSNSSGREKKGQWAVMAFAEIWHRLNMNAYKHNTSLKNEKPFNKELISFTRKSWIEGQLAFQNKYYKTNDRKNTFYERGGRYIFMAALAIAFIHIVLSWFHGEHEKPDLFHKFLTIFALSLPTIAAAFEGIRRQNEYSRNKNRSEGMKANLESLKVKFNAAKEEEDFNKLMREADILMLSETQEWMMLMEPMELELKA